MDGLSGFFSSEDEPTYNSALPPEVEEGNVEYKLKLLNPSSSRLEHLVTQMKWRLKEGEGEAIYQIGVADCGVLAGLSVQDMESSLCTLKKMADRLGASMTVLRQRAVGEKLVSEVLVRKVPDDRQFLDVRVAVVGPAEAGKSTLLGVLTRGELDNGRGKARLNLFRHLHEIQSGRTSSISKEILGFNADGQVNNYSQFTSAEEICEVSSKLITFIDLAGHHKYLKTTVFGLTAHHPDYAMLVVGANSGVVGTTNEHLELTVALKVPTFVVVTKSDLCSEAQAHHTIQQLEHLLTSPGCCKVPFVVKTEGDLCTAAQRFTDESTAPIFLVSNVTRQNFGFLEKFLNLLPPLRSRRKQEELEQQHPAFHVDEVFSVPDTGTVVGGILTSGVLREGDRMVVGPKDDGSFSYATIHSLRRNRIPCRMVYAGQVASIGLSQEGNFLIRKGTVVLSPSLINKEYFCCLDFEAKVWMLRSNTIILRKGLQVTICVASTMQNALVLEVKDEEQIERSRTVTFRFLKQPECLRVGLRMLFREAKTKGFGEITKLFPHSITPSTEAT